MYCIKKTCHDHNKSPFVCTECAEQNIIISWMNHNNRLFRRLEAPQRQIPQALPGLHLVAPQRHLPRSSKTIAVAVVVRTQLLMTVTTTKEEEIVVQQSHHHRQQQQQDRPLSDNLIIVQPRVTVAPPPIVNGALWISFSGVPTTLLV